MTSYTIAPIDPNYNIVSLAEAKGFLSIDYNDFDSLIQSLIDAAIVASQKFTGKIYTPSLVTVTTNSWCDEYPVEPYDWTQSITPITFVNDKGARRYSYVAGYAAIPSDLKKAILQRVADGFINRQNDSPDSVNEVLESSTKIEFAYRDNPMI